MVFDCHVCLLDIYWKHIGKVSKQILDKINSSIRTNSNLIQWKNTDDVINWFNNISNKNNKCFIKFDIVNFYPSITKQAILNAIKFAQKYINISDNDTEIILHSCKTILANNNETWTKKGSQNLFDVPMGSFHGAELCELIGLHILDNLKDTLGTTEYGLYRDDGLAITEIKAQTTLRQKEKLIRSKLDQLGFKITIESGLIKTDFLDISLDLSQNTYQPYKKPNSHTRYINTKSNHPPNITKGIPTMVNNRLCKISKNYSIYKNNTHEYMDALKISGHNTQQLKFENISEKKRKSRKRKSIFYNPPFCKSVKTNLGKIFINLVKKHFSSNHIYHKIFNSRTLKLSYSCMPNIKNIIQTHNNKIYKEFLNSNIDTNTRTCNCTRNRICPINNKCLLKNIVYKAEVTSTTTIKDRSNNKSKKTETYQYIGSTCDTFKARFNSHNSSFNNRPPSNSHPTELCTHIWKLKDKKDTTFKIKWEILHHIKTLNFNSKFCAVCNLEKLEISKSDKRTTLNTRKELHAKCPHHKSQYFPKVT